VARVVWRSALEGAELKVDERVGFFVDRQDVPVLRLFHRRVRDGERQHFATHRRRAALLRALDCPALRL